MKALQDLENAASGDAAVRQKIASLPQEVQDVSLLEKITGETWKISLIRNDFSWTIYIEIFSASIHIGLIFPHQ